VTGAYPARHGVFGNELFEPPDAPQTGGWHWFAREIRTDTLWNAAARRGLSTAMVSWPVAGGAGDYNVPEIFKVGGPRPETLALVKANARPPGLIEEVERHDRSLYSNVTPDESDDMRTRFGEYVIEKKRPRVMLIHLFDLDHFQHDYGPFTPEAFAMLEKVDGYVARLLAASERAGTLAETAIFIVSDHGFLPISKLIHPGVILARAGLLKAHEERDAKQGGRPRTIITDWRALPYVTSGSCAIILRDPKDQNVLDKVRRLFNSYKVREGAGPPTSRGILLRVLEAKEVRALGGNPRASLMLEAADGYSFGNSYTGEAVTQSKQLGQHGYLPTHPNYYASFIASGAGVKRRGGLGAIRMIDVGPTIARTLGLKLRDAQGRALPLK
jgi:predicted AlkP superfamily pyrophosphatase or phosphodiesterase